MKYLFLLTLSFNLHAANVLVMGDSHSAGPFGWTLDKELRASGHTVGTYASSSSVPGWFLDSTPSKWGIWTKDVNGIVKEVPFKTWGPTPNFYEISKQNPEVAIMAFGTNYVGKSSASSISDMKRFLKVLKEANIKCYWVTPPETRTYRAQTLTLFQMIKDTVGSDCEIFESHKLTHYPATGGDGVHYWTGTMRTQADLWAREIVKDFNSKF
jgi:hypothetical protein